MNEVMKKVESMNFEQIKEVYNGFIQKEENAQIENALIDAMENADFEKFIAFSEEI